MPRSPRITRIRGFCPQRSSLGGISPEINFMKYYCFTTFPSFRSRIQGLQKSTSDRSKNDLNCGFLNPPTFGNQLIKIFKPFFCWRQASFSPFCPCINPFLPVQTCLSPRNVEIFCTGTLYKLCKSFESASGSSSKITKSPNF